jgi:hypothetical protein
MTKNEREQMHHTFNALQSLGFTFDECEKLRRISMTLRRWFELECGDGDDRRSWAIERDDNGDGRPFMVTHYHPRNGAPARTTKSPIADRETGARKRLESIIYARNIRQPFQESPLVSYYIQGDPRGPALYILRPGDIPEGSDPCQYYNRGLCL